ncbi:MAG: hypothetical protein AB8C02_09465 [Halioglobus sp.]
MLHFKQGAFACFLSVFKPLRGISRVFVALALLASFTAGSAHSMPITLTHGGSGSGTIGGTAFNGEFSILAHANTEAISAFGTGFSLEHLFSQIAIVGLGTFDLLIPTRTYVNNRLGLVGFARGAGPDLLSGPAGHDAFLDWNMRSSLAMVYGRGSHVQWGLSPVQTSGGTLYFNTQAGTAARFSAQVIPVASSSWLLLLCAFPLLWRASRRKPSRQ